MPNAPTKQDLLALFERLVPPDFSAPIKGHESYSMIRAIAEIYAKLAESGSRSQQAAYFLEHARQVFQPASSGIRASGNMTLQHTGDLSRALVANPGEMRLEGRGGRFYVNADPILWYPESAPGTQITANFVCEIEGFAGNLSHLADDDGLMPLDRIDMDDQSLDRANIGGSIVLTGDGPALQDSGQPDLFRPEDTGLYVRINQANNAANLNRLLKIVGFDFPEAEIPPGTGLYPRRIFVDQNNLAVPREVFGADTSTGNVANTTDVARGVAAVSTDGLIFAPIEATAADPVSTDVGVVGGTATYNATEGAWVFTGDADQDVTFSPPQDLTGSAFTISAWVYVSSAPTSPIITSFDWSAGSDAIQFRITTGSGFLELIHIWSGTHTRRISGIALPVGEWVQVTATKDATDLGVGIHLYINGVETTYTTTTDGSGTPSDPDDDWRIGNTSLGTQPFDGMIRDVLVWGRALSPLEVVSQAFASGAFVWPARASGDALYLAGSKLIAGVRITVVTPAEGTYAPVWEYWNGAAWSALAVVSDGTADLSVAGEREVTWTVPTDMAAVASPMSGQSWYVVRYRLTAAPTFTVQPTYSLTHLIEYEALVAENGSITWEIEDFKDLGVSIAAANAPSGGRDDDLRLLGSGRGLYQQNGEDDDAFRSRAARLLDVVSPNAILRTINRALLPYGYEGQAIDVANGLTGAFLDTDFLDYYTGGDTDYAHFTADLVATTSQTLSGTGASIDGVTVGSGDRILLTAQGGADNGVWIAAGGAWARDPAWGFGGTNALNAITAISQGATYADTTWIVTAGDVIGADALVIPQLVADLFPEDPWKLLLSVDEAFGFFLVVLPYLGLGEYGFGLDDGPTALIGETYLGGAYDFGFLDGGIPVADGLYSGIYSSIDATRAVGVGFAMVRSEDANALTV